MAFNNKKMKETPQKKTVLKGDSFAKGPANFLKASTRRPMGASPTNFLMPTKKKEARSDDARQGY